MICDNFNGHVACEREVSHLGRHAAMRRGRVHAWPYARHNASAQACLLWDNPDMPWRYVTR